MNKRIYAGMLSVLFTAAALSACGTEQKPSETSGAETETMSETPVSETSSETEAEHFLFTTSDVNLRSGPGTDYESYGVLPANTSVRFLSHENGWAKVLASGQEGYISEAYLSEAGTTPVSLAETAAETAGTETQAETKAQSPVQTGVTSGASGSYNAADVQGTLTSLNLYDLSGLSNKSIPYGNDWDDKDANGIPNGIYYYENMYGKYHGVYRIKTDQKLLYLTFDEGYEAGYTPRILDTLKEKNVHAVFFLTKQFLDSDPELVQRMIDEGHVIGNHTCRHPAGGYPVYVDGNGMDSFVEDVSSLHKMVYDRFGYSMSLFRFPEGESSELLMAELDNLGYTSVFWTYAHRDFVQDDQPDPTVTLERCVNHMGCGTVYLLHAVSSSNTEALGAFIDQARANGYEFGDFPVSEVTAR